MDEERQAALIRRQYFLLGGGQLSDGGSSSKPKVYCSRCKGMGHTAQNCKLDSTLSSMNHVSEDPSEPVSDLRAAVGVDRNKAYEDAEQRAGKCPVCGDTHTYQKPIQRGSTETVPWPSSHLESCPRGESMTQLPEVGW